MILFSWLLWPLSEIQYVFLMARIESTDEGVTGKSHYVLGFLKDRFLHRNSVAVTEWHLFPGLTQGRSWLLMHCEPCFMTINLTQHSSEFYSNSKLLLGKFVLSEVRTIVNFRLFVSYPLRNILIALVWFSHNFFFFFSSSRFCFSFKRFNKN